MRIWIAAAVACMIAGATPGFAQEQEIKAPQPDWIQETPLPELSASRSKQIQYGIAYLLSDQQYFWTGDGYDFSSRVAYQIVDRSGLENAGRILRSYDPEDSTLHFSSLQIRRDGEVIDRLAETEIELIRQEEELNSGIVNGELTAVVELSDVRIGDIIDYTVFGHADTPLWPGEFYLDHQVAWSSPVAQQRLTISVPADRPLTYTHVGTDVPVTEASIGGRTVYTIDIVDGEPIPEEAYVARDGVLYGYVAFSSMDEWSDVVEWARDLYDINADLPPSYRKRVDGIAAKYPDPEDRVVEALRIVQDEIRYLGYQGGLGSHKPRPPSETVESGYGDCKDKSILLTAMLRRLNIDASPVLAAMYGGYVVPEHVPSVYAFDHAIVEVRLKGKSVWIDPTMAYQGGRFDSLVTADYGYVLPIRKGVADLALVDIPMPETPVTTLEETYEFPEDGEVGVNFTSHTIYHGREAENFRQRVATSGTTKIAREFLNFYGKYYKNLTPVGELDVQDDRDANRIEVLEHYTIDRETFEAEGYDTSFSARASSIVELLPDTLESNRKMDVWLPYGTNRRHIIRLITPGLTFSGQDTKELSGPGIDLTASYTSLGDTYEIVYDMIVDQRSAPASKLRDVVQLEKDISNEASLMINLSRARPTLARRLGFESLDPEVEKELSDLNTLIASGKAREALILANQLSNKYTDPDPVRGYVLLIKGALLADFERRKAAIAPLRESLALYEPIDAQPYFKFADLLSEQDELVELADLMVRLYEKHPDAILSTNKDWFSGFRFRLKDAGEYDASDRLMAAAAKAQYASKDEKDAEIKTWIYASSVAPLAVAGDIESAKQVASELNDPELLMSILADRRAEPVWPAIEAKNGKDLGKALDRFVEATRAKANAEDSDYLAKIDHLDALRQASLTQEAVAYGAPIIEDWARIEATGEDAFWFVNEYAYALADAGKTEEAFTLLDKLLALDIESNPDLVSMAINKTLLHMELGQFEASLSSASELAAMDDGYTSDYGRMYILDAQACALHQLGRTEEAEAVFNEEISPLSKENRGAYTHTLLCLGRLDDAEAEYIDRLSNRDDQESTLDTFVQFKGGIPVGTFSSELRKTADKVKARKSVQDALAPVGRSISIRGYDTYWGRY